jgi:hypothetical protein
MLRASGVACEVDAARLPFLSGAAELAAAGFVSGGTRNNEAFLRDQVDLEAGVPAVVATLLYDAQTSGGLLLAVPARQLAGLVEDLRGRGVEPALVGRVLQGPAGRIRVRRLPPGEQRRARASPAAARGPWQGRRPPPRTPRGAAGPASHPLSGPSGSDSDSGSPNRG